jgi:hypothetical protein
MGHSGASMTAEQLISTLMQSQSALAASVQHPTKHGDTQRTAMCAPLICKSLRPAAQLWHNKTDQLLVL